MKFNIRKKVEKYDIRIIKKGLKKASELFDLDRKVLIITDKNIPDQYINEVASQAKESLIYKIEPGEKSKNIEVYKDIMNYMIENEFVRSDAIVAMGGGVVGDISAFVASTYMRGIDFYNIPTSLLAQVDSSIGGKTAIDFCGIKNIIGSFYQPKGVLIDVSVLKTLPEREINNGMAEIIKIAAIQSKDLFSLLENEQRTKRTIMPIIDEAVKLKKIIVEKDEKESGFRRVLNFGHTIGHAIEESCEGKLLHGECVALGMLYFSSKEAREKIISLLKKYDLPYSYEINKEKVLELIMHDKKKYGEKINIIYVEKIGSCTLKSLTINEIREIIEKNN